MHIPPIVMADVSGATNGIHTTTEGSADVLPARRPNGR
jgi:hypothetical protein